LVVFARSPVLGKVKSRLAADIGDAAALRIYRAMAQSVWQNTAGGQFARWLFFTPIHEEKSIREFLPGADRYVPQSESENLGDRLERAFETAFGSGAEQVVVVGTDLPGLTSKLVQESFLALDDHSAVLGPTTDGGFWLLGLAAPAKVSFAGIEWGTSSAGGAMINNLRKAGHQITSAPELTDVDTVDDLRRVPELWALVAAPKEAP
jgi:rSAM/selenodomain-associated transferase 1